MKGIRPSHPWRGTLDKACAISTHREISSHAEPQQTPNDKKLQMSGSPIRGQLMPQPLGQRGACVPQDSPRGGAMSGSVSVGICLNCLNTDY